MTDLEIASSAIAQTPMKTYLGHDEILDMKAILFIQAKSYTRRQDNSCSLPGCISLWNKEKAID